MLFRSATSFYKQNAPGASCSYYYGTAIKCLDGYGRYYDGQQCRDVYKRQVQMIRKRKARAQKQILRRIQKKIKTLKKQKRKVQRKVLTSQKERRKKFPALQTVPGMEKVQMRQQTIPALFWILQSLLPVFIMQRLR